MFEAAENFHDDILRDELRDLDIDQLTEMLQLCINKELFKQARIVKLEMESRTV